MKSSVSVSKVALAESLNVLSRTEAVTAQDQTGGLHGESSVVLNNGDVIQGQSGNAAYINSSNQLQTDETLPNLPAGATDGDVEVGIHSHVTGAFAKDGYIYSGNALAPSDVDQAGASRFNTNIIVGPLGSAKESNLSPGKPYQKPNGIVIYQNGKTVAMKEGAVNKIIQKNES